MPAKNKNLILGLLALVLVGGVWYFSQNLPTKKTAITPTPTPASTRQYEKSPLNLPAPTKSSRYSLEQALQERRSQRAFTEKALTLKQLGQMLWAAQGVTASWGGRTAPSAKDSYPLEIYVVVNNVDGLDKGVYHYLAGDIKALHQLGLVKSGDFKTLVEEAVVQSPAKGAPVVFYIAGNFDKMTEAFDGKPANNNVYLEVGHAAQNMYLQAQSLGLGMVTIGGFNAVKSKAVLNLPVDETLIYAIPLGYVKQ